MESVVFEVAVDQTKYRGTFFPKESRISFEKQAEGSWAPLGSGLWSSKHIVFCTAKLPSYAYLLFEEKLSETKL